MRFCGYRICKNADNTRENGDANLISQDKSFLERLRLLKDKSNMTTKQIAEKSGIPEPTITRIFSGKTPNPTIISVIDIIRAMGGKASDVFDDDAQVNTQLNVPQAVVSDIEKKNLEIAELYKGIINSKNETIESQKKTIKTLSLALLLIVCVIIFILLFDMFNGGIGYFRA